MVKKTPAKQKPSQWWHGVSHGVLLLYVIASLMAVFSAIGRPVYNWDMIGYVGSVVASQTEDKTIIHQRALDEVLAVTPQVFHATFTKNRLSNDVENFNRQIPFYSIKPLYVAAIDLIHQLGAGLAEATWLISTVFFIVLAAAISQWQPQAASRNAWLLSVVALMWLGNLPMAKLAAYSTPDAMAIAFLMVALVAWWRNQSLAGLMIGSSLAILTRPDALITVLGLVVYFGFFARGARVLALPRAAAVALVVIGLYAALRHTLGSMGWETLFYRGFINDNFDFTVASVSITWEQYWRALSWGISKIAINPRLITLALLSMAALICYRVHQQREWLWFLLMGWGTFAVRFALFPNWGDERYHYFSYLIIIMASLELITPVIKSYKLVKK